MKLTALALLPALAASAQTTTHHTSTRAAAHRSATCPADADLTGLSPAIPKATGCPKALYSERYLDIVVGTGPVAEPRKFYNVDYTGYLPDGTVFDSSKEHGPITFPQGSGRVIPGFDTAFEGMHIGGKRRVFIPYEIAYGATGVPKRPDRPGNGIPPKSMLIFDLTLNSISDTPPKPKTPPVPPAGAKPAGTPGSTTVPGTTPAPAKPLAQPAAAPAPGTATPTPTAPAGTPQAGSAQTVIGKPTTTTPASPTTDPTKPTTTTPPQR